MDTLLSKQIGEFTVIERIGRGGMATVYRAHQPSMHRDVALKVLPLDEAPDTSFSARFEQEAEMIARLEHIHILPVYSYGIQNNVAYLAMRLLRGGSLADLMDGQPLSMERTVDLFSQVSQGLAYAHSKGIIHRDLKPANILLDEVGHAYLTDFGLAKMIDGERDMTKPDNIVGTPSYMSPEQLRGEHLDHRTDIYSAGVILYQMLTGKKPFDGDSSDVISIIYKHLEKMPPRPRELNPNLPVEVEQIVMKALAKSPDDRFDTIGEMAGKLQLVTGIRSTSSYPVPAQELTSTGIRRRAVRRKQLLVKIGIASAVIALFVVVAAALILNSIRSSNQFTQFVITENQKGTLASSIPTVDEIVEAQRRLGEDGFVAVLPCNLSSEYHSTLTREITDFARKYGVKNRIYDADSDAYRQTTLIETARAEGANAFIICPLDSTLSAPLTALDEADYPLVLPAAGDGDGSYGGVIINTDNFLLGLLPGRTAGRYIRDKLNGEARVVILDYPDLDHLVTRANGLEAGILEIAPDAVIVGRFRGGTREAGKQSIRTLIAQGESFNVIASINDAGAYGAIDAMVEGEISPSDVSIFSVDAEQLAQEHILNDYFIRASVEVARTAYAEAAVGMIVKQLAGATLPEIISLDPGKVITKSVLEDTQKN
jgi:serine/threonine protein kinase/DNA-binding LacI/PurR family transcriptional regulator